MTIYDILERAVMKIYSDEFEREAALEVVRELRQLNAFGTLTGKTTSGEHECQPSQGWPQRCTICQAILKMYPDRSY